MKKHSDLNKYQIETFDHQDVQGAFEEYKLFKEKPSQTKKTNIFEESIVAKVIQNKMNKHKEQNQR